MQSLATRLKDVQQAGMYPLNCSPSSLRDAVADAELAFFELDLAAVHGKAEFLAALAQAFQMPAWFGANWDALADALSDLSWRPAAGYVLLLQNSGATFNLTAEDYRMVRELLLEMTSFWKKQGKPCWIFFA